MLLGLTTGLVVFIVALTGCLWVFNKELKSLVEEPFIVEKKEVPKVTPTKARLIAEKVLPGRHIHGVEYGGDTSPIEVIFFERKNDFYQSVYLDPYNGEVLRTTNHFSGFFHFVLNGHMYLWLPKAVGKQIVSWSTFVFLVMLITGIILWWPKNKKARKQRFLFNWKATTKWRRKNFDLHTITGFYASLFLLLIAITGLVMAFNWFAFLVYKGVGGEKSMYFIVPENKAAHSEVVGEKPIDFLIPKLQKAYKNAESFELHYPESDSSSIYIEISYDDEVYYNNDYRFYDQNTGEEIPTSGLFGAYENADASDKVSRMNYDIHIGAILGFPGKIIAFVASFLCATLPVTGFLMWWGRRKKKKE